MKKRVWLVLLIAVLVFGVFLPLCAAEKVDQPSLKGELTAVSSLANGDVAITEEEQGFIQGLPIINIGYDQGQKPLSYTDENGEFKGIARDVLDRISEMTGISFFYKELPASDVTTGYLQKNDIYVLANVESNDNNLSVKNMQLSAPFLASEKVMVAKEVPSFTKDAALKIGVSTGSGLFTTTINRYYPNFEVEAFPSVEACLTAVARGSLDGAMVNRYLADSALESPAFKELSVVPVEYMRDDISVAILDFGVQSPMETYVNDPMFLSVINKAIGEISTEELNGYIITNTVNSRYEATFLDLVWAYKWEIILFLLLIFYIIVLLLRMGRNHRRNAVTLGQANAKLEAAVAEADAANAAKSRFLAQMSHEIRTPINAIVGLTAIAERDENTGAKSLDTFHKIESSAKLLMGIINDVLDMSAIEGNKLKIDSAPFSLKQLLTEISAIFYQEAKVKNIALTVAVEGIVGETVVGDALRVKQILMNLLSNAVKFTSSGGSVKLLVTLSEQRKEERVLQFVVQDSGVGMSEDMQKRLFLPFEQESAATARKYGGSGLGLSITKSLTQMMGGAIAVESRLGEGTAFTVTIPFGNWEDTTTYNNPAFAKLRTLLIAEERAFRTYCGLLFDSLGIPYTEVNADEAALAVLGEAEEGGNPYGLSLVDWEMFDKNGVDIAKKIREMYGRDDMALLVSAYDISEAKEKGRELAVDGYLPKPLFLSTVYHALMGMVGGDAGETPKEAAEKHRSFYGKRALLAEDVILNLEVAVNLLRMMGLEVVGTEDGKQAVALYKKFPSGYFDCIFLDINMPVMDGYEAAKAIRQSGKEDAAAIPIFAMTANVFSDDVEAALAAGMNGHITKPVEIEKLRGLLEAYLG